ncbi:uncharacterized protein LOC100899132 isoform X2 [Galendromus occidentalis]|uniref:Uncharacterized protein LOC100899132 isoform X2 n=1 Tax=Galendromus occidentalis TaxID=34638 RepID=A0AAJ6VYJ9_9ACAR|nr:uncharacterized protein LOC100899132 isoform X2 [Galendromus occidentalis]
MLTWNYSLTDVVIAVLGICVVFNLLILMMRSLRRAAAGSGGSSVVFVKNPILETQVQSLSTPATVYDIKDLGDKTVELDIRSHREHCKFVAYWGVPIKDFPWSDAEPPHQHKEELLLGYVGSHRLQLNVKDCELGDQPRTHYHLVTVISAPEAESMLYSIYHLYGCSLKTSLLKQYLKSESGSMLASYFVTSPIDTE